jgi:hypothetical protein
VHRGDELCALVLGERLEQRARELVAAPVQLCALGNARLSCAESSPSRLRRARTSQPAVPISQRTRASPSGRPRARKLSLSAPIRWVTLRLKLRTSAISCSAIV